MKIKVTEIEANAEELKMCNTLSQNLNAMLARAFAPHTFCDDENEQEENGDTE